MNILNAFTRRSLRENRTRTLVTVIGIVLSMALMTAVLEGAYSGQQYMIRNVAAEEGTWHIQVAGLDAAQAEAVRGMDGVADSALWQEVGWGEIGSVNEYKPYLLVEAIGDGLEDLVAVHLTDGHMPESDTEILLPSHLADNGGVRYQLGDELRIALGRRVDEAGQALGPKNPLADEQPEYIADAREHRYTVVGFYERFTNDIERYDCPGYTALTGDGGRGAYTVFLSLLRPSRSDLWQDEHATGGDISIHSNLLMFYGSITDLNLSSLLYGFAAILIILIAFGSISLIYNSFSISVSERTRQFGILKSVGATKKQLRHSVLYEALLLSAVGIPVGLVVGCAGIGITLYLLRPAFDSFVNYSDVQIGLVLDPAALGIAVLVCLVTTLISASIPARRAMRLSPIDAIRRSADVKIRAKEVRTSRLTEKLFGFEGAMASKNFKRDRRRYRSTVVSLFLSVTLFISASSLCAYLTDAVSGDLTYSDTGEDITYRSVGDDKPDPDELLALLGGVPGVTEGLYYDSLGTELRLPTAGIDSSALDVWFDTRDTDAGTQSTFANLIFLDDDSFAALCRDNGLDPARYAEPDEPRFVLCNHGIRISYTDSGIKFANFQFFDSAALPLDAAAVRYEGPEGYFEGEIYEKDGTEYVVWYPNNSFGELTPDSPDAIWLPAEDAAVEMPVTIDAALEAPPPSIPVYGLYLIAPYSLRERFGGEDDFDETQFAFKAENHAAAFDAMRERLEDRGLPVHRLYDYAADKESMRMLVLVVNVFSYGFIVLISLIAVANVFNTISTSISLRRREFAMLKSVGLGHRGFRRMMDFECVIYGARGLMWGLPASVLMTYAIWRVTLRATDAAFYIPWYSVAIAVGSVFLVVFITMLYATDKIKKDNPIDALKNENL